MNKFVIGASLVLAAFTATPTFAATAHRTSHVAASQNYPESYDANASADRDLTAGGPAVFSNGQYAGWDPDPNIRFQLQRDPGAQAGN
jgi:hypothetical protein